MTRLGPDIEAAQAKSGPWSAVRIAGYARKMLSLLRSLHEQSKMVFVDVKPGTVIEDRNIHDTSSRGLLGPVLTSQ